MSEYKEDVVIESIPSIVSFVGKSTEGDQIRVITDRELPDKVKVQRVLIFPGDPYGDHEFENKEKIVEEKAYGEEDVKAGVNWLSKQNPYKNEGANSTPDLGVAGVILAKVDVALRELDS